MRIALNSWLDCGVRARPRSACRRGEDLATCHKAKFESCAAHKPGRPAEDGGGGGGGGDGGGSAAATATTIDIEAATATVSHVI